MTLPHRRRDHAALRRGRGVVSAILPYKPLRDERVGLRGRIVISLCVLCLSVLRSVTLSEDLSMPLEVGRKSPDIGWQI